MGWNLSIIDYKDEEVPVKANLNNSQVNIILDGSNLRTDLKIVPNSALELADSILHALEELTSEELKDKILDLERENEELRNIVEQYEEQNDAYREKLTESCSPF